MVTLCCSKHLYQSASNQETRSHSRYLRERIRIIRNWWQRGVTAGSHCHPQAGGTKGIWCDMEPAIRATEGTMAGRSCLSQSPQLPLLLGQLPHGKGCQDPQLEKQGRLFLPPFLQSCQHLPGQNLRGRQWARDSGKCSVQVPCPSSKRRELKERVRGFRKQLPSRAARLSR